MPTVRRATTRGQRAYPRTAVNDGLEYPPLLCRCGRHVDNCRSATHRKHLDPRQVAGRRRAQLGVTIVANPPDGGDDVPEIVIRSSGSEDRPKVVALGREQARVELALSGDTGPGA